jgi:hypothetical protein
MITRSTDTRPWEHARPLPARDRVRAKAVDAIPWWYSPWAHLAFPSLVGFGLIAASVALLDQPTWREWLTVPIVLLLVNVNEWFIHRNILHQRTWPLDILFWRHTPEHHVIFVRDDMAMRATREFRLVLIPFYGILAIFLSTLPITAALWLLVSHDVALLWVASTMGYVVAYEWLHLAYHLPESNPIARTRVIRWLRRHHAVHHTPELMQRWNFNVTVPFADWLLKTVHGGR